MRWALAAAVIGDSGNAGSIALHASLGFVRDDNVAIDEEGTITLVRLVSLCALLGLGLALMAVMTAVNLLSARSYGEFEFWFSSIKVGDTVVTVGGLHGVEEAVACVTVLGR